MFSKHSLTPTKGSFGPLLYKITPSKVASHSQSNASVSEGLRMLDLSQFKRSEEEVHAQIEAKQALRSEIIEEKVKKKCLIHDNHRNEIREKGKKSNTVS